MLEEKDKKLIFTTEDGHFVETTEREVIRLSNKLKKEFGNSIDASIRVISNHLDCKRLKSKYVAVLIIASAYMNTSNVEEYLKYIHDLCNHSEDEIMVMVMDDFLTKTISKFCKK